MDGIKVLFMRRDEAVAKKDFEQFASTQLQNIPYASIEGYISCDKLETTVLFVANETELKKVVFVKEDYLNHTAFLLYYIVNTVNGWKIYNIVSSFS